MQRRVTKQVFLVLFLLTFVMSFSGRGSAQTPAAPTTPPAEKEKAVSPPSLAEFIPWATGLSDRLAALNKRIQTLVDLSAAGKQFQALSNEVDGIAANLKRLKTAGAYHFRQIADLRQALRLQSRALVESSDPLTVAIAQLGQWETEWSNENIKAKQFRSSLPKAVAPGTVRPVLTQAQNAIDSALSLIARELKPLLEAQRRAGELQARISSLNSEIDSLLLDVRGNVFRKSDPSMLSSEYYSQFDRGLWEHLGQGFTHVSLPGREFLADEGWAILLQCVVAILLAVSIRRRRRFFEQSERWRFLSGRPVAAGLFVAVSTITPFQGSLPALWLLLLWVVGGVALGRLAGALITRPWRQRLLYALIVILIFNQLLRIIAVPRPLLRLYMFTLALVGLVLFLWRARENARRGDSPLYPWALRAGGLILLFVLGAEVSGYAILGTRLLGASLRTVFLVLVAWMLMLLGRGGLEWTLYSSPLKSVPLWRSAADVVAGKAAILLNFLIGIFFGAIILSVWGAYDNPMAALEGLMSLGVTVGTGRITVGLVITAGAFLYGSLIASWIVQAALTAGVFSRRQLQTGIRISISRLIHYGFVFVGFVVALVTLGFDFRELTIIAGALGVGIGFGLQAIVNNFVCGLILLFERPIKVGDSIQLGEQWGKIKHIGLRATIVQTLDNAEIVVPNNDLVANQVTNWTLSDRQSRILLPVGVAYGSDVALVIETLRASAEENPLVLRVPPPQVVFTGFGESSLDFRLQVWIADVDTRLQVQTEILQEIDRRFRQLGIEIPFPQRDLHVRTVTDSASQVLMGSPQSKPGPTAPKEKE
jgi:potassium efflux system protein